MSREQSSTYVVREGAQRNYQREGWTRGVVGIDVADGCTPELTGRLLSISCESPTVATGASFVRDFELFVVGFHGYGDEAVCVTV